MSDNELKKWLWKKINSCYCVKHDDFPEYIFMYYDKDFIRKCKFKILQGEKIVYPKNPTGVCLFSQDYKNGWLWCDSNYIWQFLGLNTNYNYQEICNLIKGWLEEDTKLKVLTPKKGKLTKSKRLNEDTKLKVLTPNC